MLEFFAILVIVFYIALFLSNPLMTLLGTALIGLLCFGIAWVIAYSGKR